MNGRQDRTVQVMLHHYSTGRHSRQRTHAPKAEQHGPVARIASDLPRDPVVDVVADGLTEDEIAARFEAWLANFDSLPTVDLSVSAADELRRAYADDDV